MDVPWKGKARCSPFQPLEKEWIYIKTGEIYTLALTKPEAKFKSVGQQFGDFVVCFNGVGKLVDEEGDLVFPTYCNEWELIPQDVTWQEALQAWIDGKIPYFVMNGNRTYLNDSFHLRLRDFANRPISKDEISKGKWYIE